LDGTAGHCIAPATPGKRTVSAVLRIMGLGQAGGFALYHHGLSQARWDSRAIACKLLAMILDRFLPAGPVIIGIDGLRAVPRHVISRLVLALRTWTCPSNR